MRGCCCVYCTVVRRKAGVRLERAMCVRGGKISMACTMLVSMRESEEFVAGVYAHFPKRP